MSDLNMKILVVDDFATMRRILKNLLKQNGYTNIEEAEDGVQAYEKLKAGGYGFIVSDWNMPKMDGLELVKAIRKNADIKDLPILMVTAEAEKDKIYAALKAGVSNYILKPFTGGKLKEIMDGILEKMDEDSD